MARKTATGRWMYFDDGEGCGLRRYVHLVSQAMGLRGECSFVQEGEHACAYVALDGRLPLFPDRDVALLWDETQGWSAAIETHSGEDLLTVATLGEDVLPPPRTVAAWAVNLFRPSPPAGRAGDGRDMPHRPHTDDRPTPAVPAQDAHRLGAA